MESRYNQTDAEAVIRSYPDCNQHLAIRTYTSRLIGSDTGLVLHGGGNTSVKITGSDIFGVEKDILFIKGSGIDLSSINPSGFAGLYLDPLNKLRNLEHLSDTDLDHQMKSCSICSNGPAPSVETLLHAFLPHKFIDHTHADSILVLTHQKNCRDLILNTLGDRTAVIPYTMSGLPLARSVIELYETNPDIDAIVVENHGIFTFANNARQSYEKMIESVTRAETFIQKKISRNTRKLLNSTDTISDETRKELARYTQIIRGVCAQTAKDGSIKRYCTESRTDADIIGISLLKNAHEICSSGVLTPDHAIRTKNNMVFLRSDSNTDEKAKNSIQRAVNRFSADYRTCYQKWCGEALDPALSSDYPLVFLIRGLGLVTVANNPEAAKIAADTARHTLRAKTIGMDIGEYIPISNAHAFQMEHWCFQQKKLKGTGHLPLEGQVALITGCAGAIGYGIADRLLSAGACVALSDIDKRGLKNVSHLLCETYDKHRIYEIILDVTDPVSIQNAFNKISLTFGGIDILVPNAGIAHVAEIEHLDLKDLHRVLNVNLIGAFTVMKAAIPVFKRQQTGGNIVLISSKNVFDPGAAFGAYSASKAGAHQLARIAAIELADIGVRVNMVNPDAVFGDETVCSKLWECVGPDRMKSRGLDAEGLQEYYRCRSLLKQQVLARHVGNAVVFFASELTPTTGAALPVDGGNSATFSR